MNRTGLSREMIKYIAVIAMTADHAALFLLGEGSSLYLVCRAIGGMTAITMSFFLAEGFRKTKNPAVYAGRLFLCAAVSQIPWFFLSRHTEGLFPLNVVWNLLFSLMILEWLRRSAGMAGRIAGAGILTAACCFCDWGILMPCYVLLFSETAKRFPGRKGPLRNAWIIAVLLNALSAVSFGNGAGHFGTGGIRFAAEPLLSCIGQILAAVFVLVFYHGETEKRHQRFHQYFFYVWYPLHLGILLICTMADRG